MVVESFLIGEPSQCLLPCSLAPLPLMYTSPLSPPSFQRCSRVCFLLANKSLYSHPPSLQLEDHAAIWGISLHCLQSCKSTSSIVSKPSISRPQELSAESFEIMLRRHYSAVLSPVQGTKLLVLFKTSHYTQYILGIQERLSSMVLSMMAIWQWKIACITLSRTSVPSL